VHLARLHSASSILKDSAVEFNQHRSDFDKEPDAHNLPKLTDVAKIAHIVDKQSHKLQKLCAQNKALACFGK